MLSLPTYFIMLNTEFDLHILLCWLLHLTYIFCYVEYWVWLTYFVMLNAVLDLHILLCWMLSLINYFVWPLYIRWYLLYIHVMQCRYMYNKDRSMYTFDDKCDTLKFCLNRFHNIDFYERSIILEKTEQLYSLSNTCPCTIAQNLLNKPLKTITFSWIFLPRGNMRFYTKSRVVRSLWCDLLNDYIPQVSSLIRLITW